MMFSTKHYLFLMAVLISLASVNAAVPTPIDSAYAWFPFNQSTGNLIDVYYGLEAEHASIGYETNKPIYYNISGRSWGDMLFDNVVDYVNYSFMDNGSGTPESLGVSMWYNISNGIDGTFLAVRNSNTILHALYDNGIDAISFRIRDEQNNWVCFPSSSVLQEGDNTDDSDRHLLYIFWNLSEPRCVLCVDNVCENQTGGTAGGSLVGELRTGQRETVNDRGWTADARIYDLKFWNASLTEPQLHNLYNYGNITGPAASPPGIPILTQPVDNDFINNNQLVLKWTGTADNYTLYIQNVTPPSSMFELNTTTNYTAVLSTQQKYYWRIQANNDIGSTNSSIYSFTYDETQPNIQWNYPALDNSTTSNTAAQNLWVEYYNHYLLNATLRLYDPSLLEVFTYNNQSVNTPNVTVQTIYNAVVSGNYTAVATAEDNASNEVIETVKFFIDYNNPAYSGLSNNAGSETYTGSVVNFILNASDDIALSAYIFSWNDTGNFVNNSKILTSGSFQTLNTPKTITANENDYICGLYYLFDTLNNSNSTGLSCLTVQAQPEQILGDSFGFFKIVPLIILAFLFVVIFNVWKKK